MCHFALCDMYCCALSCCGVSCTRLALCVRIASCFIFTGNWNPLKLVSICFLHTNLTKLFFFWWVSGWAAWGPGHWKGSWAPLAPRARVKGSKLNLFTRDLKTNLRSQRVWPWTTSHQLNGTKPIIISQFTATCPQEYLADTLTNLTWLYSHYGKKLRRPGREPKPLTTFLAALASHTLPCQHPFVWRHCWSMKTS